MVARSLAPRSLAALALTLGALAAAGCGGGDDDGAATTAASGSGGAATIDAPALFEQRCGSCHALEAAGTSGGIGPDLDDLRPDAARVLAAIREGPSAMPPNLAQGAEAQALARYVSQSAGG